MPYLIHVYRLNPVFHRCVPDSCLCPDGRTVSVTSRLKELYIGQAKYSDELRKDTFAWWPSIGIIAIGILYSMKDRMITILIKSVVPWEWGVERARIRARREGNVAFFNSGFWSMVAL